MTKQILQIPMMVFSSVFIASMMTACGGSSSSPSTGDGSSSSPTDGSTTGGKNTGGKNTGDNSYSGATKCVASNVGFRNGLYDDTYIVKASRPNSSKKIDPNDPAIVETCGFGTVCYVDDYKGTLGRKPRNGGKAFCANSILDAKSPYKDFGADRGFSEWIRYPTKLEIDCRSRQVSVIGSQKNGGNGGSPANPNNIDPTKGGHPKGAIMNCQTAGRLDAHTWPVAYGDGPVFSDFNKGNKVWYGAEFNPETRELFSLVNWTNSNHDHNATVVAWNVDTKARRIVSGIYPNSKTGDENFGSGYLSPEQFHANTGKTQPMTDADSIRLAKDGFLYVSSPNEIIRVNQDTGKRELVWKRQNKITGVISNTYGQCLRPSYLGEKHSLGIEFKSFTVGPKGKFYKGFRDVKGGNGVLEFSKDGKTCKVLTRWNGKGDASPDSSKPSIPAPADIGSGYLSASSSPQINGMLVHDGKVYVVMQKLLVSVDLSNGNRKLVSDPKNKYPAGYTSMHYDKNRKVIWTSGSVAALFGNVVVDPKTGQTEQITNDQMSRRLYPGKEIFKSVYPMGRTATGKTGAAVGNNNPLQYGGVIVDPKDPDIAYGVSSIGSLIKYEISTYNNYHHSWGQY